jgi:hypothetical protein
VHFGVKAARNLSKGLLAVLREDDFDIDGLELGVLIPKLVVVPFRLKTKTTKTP